MAGEDADNDGEELAAPARTATGEAKVLGPDEWGRPLLLPGSDPGPPPKDGMPGLPGLAAAAFAALIRAATVFGRSRPPYPDAADDGGAITVGGLKVACPDGEALGSKLVRSRVGETG